jgi:CheY-like chemotaxis protein
MRLRGSAKCAHFSARRDLEHSSLVPVCVIYATNSFDHSLRRVFVETEEPQGLTPREAYLRAKVEHWLERAQECFQMSRYQAALRALEPIFRLDPSNMEAQELRRTAEEYLKTALRRQNGELLEGNGQHSNRHSELVMIVDQDETLLTTLTATLRRFGFRTIAADSYEEAMETLSIARPDLVISEVNFASGPKGFDLFLWLKTNGQHNNAAFMFLAARLDREALIAGKRFGVDDFLLKPVDAEVVATMATSCLSRNRKVGVPVA